MNSRKVWIIGTAVILLIAVGLPFFLGRHAVRPDLDLLQLLPADMDLYAVADLQSLGTNPLIQKLLADPPGITHDVEYDRFIEATGFRYQKDLKRVALARSGADWIGAARVTLDRPRIIKYMESQGGEKKDALGKTVFTFGRTRPFRLVFLDDQNENALVAFTIGGDEAWIRQEVESRLGHASSSGATELQQGDHFQHIPLESKIWLIGKPNKMLEADGASAQVGSLGLNKGFFRGSKTLYVSVESGLSRLDLHVEDYCDSPASAQRIATSLQGILALLKAMPANKSAAAKKGAPSGRANAPDADITSLLAGASVEQKQQSVFLQWQLDERAWRYLEGDPH